MKKIGKWIFIPAIVIAAGIILFLCFLILAQVLEYRPGAVIPLENLGNRELPQPGTPPAALSLLSWNIGYCGLDAKTDFVMEGGKMSLGRSRQAVLQNLAEVKNILDRVQADIYFIQEVDRPSTRSFQVDQVSELLGAFPGYQGWYGLNYRVFFVPYPVSAPIGGVKSGMLSLSRFPADAANRYQLPGQYGWPVRLFHLKRCLLVIHFQGPAGKDWYLIQLHLSAYDQSGNLRKEQLAFVREYALELYNQGHYVVVGGDWNSLFPGTSRTDFLPYTTAEEYLFWVRNIPGDFTPHDWQWVYDPAVPTCRSLEQPFIAGENFSAIIDGFLISPNLVVEKIRTIPLNFQNADHNPVYLGLRIKEF